MVVAVGIDLGTTFSCVAALVNGHVKVIQSMGFGQRVMPSYVAFVEEEEKELVGHAAKAKAIRDPRNTVYDVKRIIGRSFNEESLQADLDRWPFNVINVQGRPKIQIIHRTETKTFSPQEISAMVLRQLAADASMQLGQKVDAAVITVPAYFTDSQKRATREAGELAGLKVLRLLPEPTAAALAYGLEHRFTGDRNVLVYDLGGGTFDVSIVTIGKSHYKVRGVGGNSHLGGTDFDYLIFQYVAEEIRRVLPYEIGHDARKMHKLFSMCEAAKTRLSAMTCTEIDVGELTGEDDCVVYITRAKLEELCKEHLESTITTVTEVLATAGMDPSEIDDVVLVGGSTKMNCIINMLRRVFPGKTISRAINPDEAVAVGAAHMAAIINNDSGAFLDGLRVDNVTPLSIGVEVFRGVFHVVIPKNSVVPVRVGKLYKTGYDNQSEVPFTVYQGERALVKKNKLIGTFLLKDLPASPAGLGLMAMLAIDEDGILAVEARVLPDGQYRGCKLQLTDQSNTEILSKLEDAARYREEDQKEVERLKARYELEQHLAIAKEKNVPDAGEIQEWLVANPDAPIDLIESKLNILRSIV